MVTYLLDTNVLSELVRPRPDAGVRERFAQAAPTAAIAAVTWHEMRFGIARMPAGRRRDALDAFVVDLAARLPVLAYDRRAAEWHAAERARRERTGAPSPFADVQIAATAVAHGLRLVTRNVADFAGFAGLVVEDWWSGRG